MADFFDNDSLSGGASGLGLTLSGANLGLNPKIVSMGQNAAKKVLGAALGEVGEQVNSTVGKLVASKAAVEGIAGKLGSLAEKAGNIDTSSISSAIGGAKDLLGDVSSLGGSGSPLPELGTNPDATPLTDTVGWKENVLSDMQSPTYHIRMFAVDDQPVSFSAFSTYDALHQELTKNKKSTTIAESGVTGLNIMDFSIDSNMAPNDKTRSTAAKQIKMTVYEPGGVSFMDMLADTAIELEVKDYSKAIYYIELSFMGYRDGQFVLNPCTSFNNKGSWLFAVMIINMDVSVSETGATYEMTLIPVEEQIASSETIRLPAQLSPSGSTIGEMVNDLAKQLTDAFKSMYGYEYHTFKVEIPSFVFNGSTYEPANFPTTAFKPELADKKSVKMEVVDGVMRGQFPTTMLLNDVVEMIFSNSEKVQQLGKGVMKPMELDDYGEKFRECVLFRINFITVVKRYDPITKAYLNEYSIVISPYFTERPILSTKQIATSAKNEVQIANARKLREQGFLCKRYDYLYSGQNTEILDFDISYNANWVALLPKALGLYHSNEATAAQDFVKPADQIQTVDEEVRQLQKILGAHAQIDNRVNEINSSSPADDSERERNAKELSELKTAKDHLTMSAAQATDRIGQLVSIRTDIVKNMPKPKLNVPERPQLRYSEEVHEAASQTLLENVLPISTAQSPRDTRWWPGGSFQDTHTRDRTILGAIFDQMYDQTGSSLQSITMKIKGDPFWLGCGNTQRSWDMINSKTVALEKKSNEDYQDFHRGDALMLVSFRYPRGIGEDGSPIIKSQDFFTGVYLVTTVKSEFKDGSFTQTLEALRQPLIDVYKAFGAPSKDSKDADTSTPSLTEGECRLNDYKSAAASAMAENGGPTKAAANALANNVNNSIANSVSAIPKVEIFSIR